MCRLPSEIIAQYIGSHEESPVIHLELNKNARHKKQEASSNT